MWAPSRWRGVLWGVPLIASHGEPRAGDRLAFCLVLWNLKYSPFHTPPHPGRMEPLWTDSSGSLGLS